MNQISLRFAGQPSRTSDLSAKEREQVSALVEGAPDTCPAIVQYWNKVRNDTTWYFIIWRENAPVGLIGWSGLPSEVTVGYWMHPNHQNQKYGYAAIDALADEMRRQNVTGFGTNAIQPALDHRYGQQTAEHETGIATASKKLLRRLKKHLGLERA